MEKYGENFEYQKRECLRRARSVEYIAANDARVLKRERLEILKGLMQVKDILLIGPSGEILLSTSVSLEGTGENEDVMEQLREKQTDADRENGKETPGVVRADTPGFADKPEYLYAVAASDTDDIAGVRVDADLSRLELVSGKDCFYINDGMIDCMKSECTGCRADCPRSRVINQKGAERPDK